MSRSSLLLVLCCLPFLLSCAASPGIISVIARSFSTGENSPVLLAQLSKSRERRQSKRNGRGSPTDLAHVDNGKRRKSIDLSNTIVKTGSSGSADNSKNVNHKGNVKSSTDNKIDDIKNVFSKNINRFIQGGKNLFPNFMTAEKLKRLRKAGGDAAITFTQFKFLDTAKEDFGKCLRLGVTFPLSPEFFFYSYIVFPMMSPSNPWAWRAMPSTFDLPEEKELRNEALSQRRIQSLVSIVNALKVETNADISTTIRNERVKQVNRIEKALSAKNLRDALDALNPWLLSEPKSATSPTLAIKAGKIVGSALRDASRACGGEGYPNLPLVKRMNIGDIKSYVDRLRESDQFISNVGVDSLNDSEIREACFDRCIRINGRGKSALRRDLEDWIDLATEPVSMPSSSNRRGGLGGKAPLMMNAQNRRLALMCLHASKDLASSPYASTYRCLLQ